MCWWCMPLVPELGKQSQEDLCEFNDSLVYRKSSSYRETKATEKSCLRETEENKTEKVKLSSYTWKHWVSIFQEGRQTTA